MIIKRSLGYTSIHQDSASFLGKLFADAAEDHIPEETMMVMEQKGGSVIRKRVYLLKSVKAPIFLRNLLRPRFGLPGIVLYRKRMLISKDGMMITNERHTYALQQARASLGKVKESIENGMPEDFYSIDLMDAYESLGHIIGESVDDDLVNEIFAKFCMGK